MTVTAAPSTEALHAIRDRINDRADYVLEVSAVVAEQIVDPLEDVAGLCVDVANDEEEQLIETLNDDPTSHVVRVWVRQKLDENIDEHIDSLKLVTRQIYNQLKNYDSRDGRVRVWEIDSDSKEMPNKPLLQQHRLFVASVVCRVEVGP